MRKWKVWSYYVPDGKIRLRVRAARKINGLSSLLTNDIIWSGRPHLPFLRWFTLIFCSLGLSQCAFGFLMRLPFRDIWCIELFGVVLMFPPLLESLDLMFTKYIITTEKILVIRRLYGSVNEFDLSHFASRTDVFGFYGTFRQLPGTYDVQFLKCADASPKGARNWRRFMSVSKSDAKIIADALRRAVAGFPLVGSAS